MSWIHKTALQQRAALDSGEISSLQLLEETIAQAEQLKSYVNPIAYPLYDRAREAAIRADRKLSQRKGGALCGIPVTVKDSQWLAGYPCANGSVTLKDFVPNETSASIQRLEQADAVVFAKTTCPEFSLTGITESEMYGRTSNPWDLSKTPGGSSGGAAAAVAASIGSLSLGGDGGGSIRIPSAFCGVVGFKPSFGLVPRAPGFTTWESLVAYGPICRSIADAKLMYSVLVDQPVNLESSDELFTCIASEDLGFAPVDLDVRTAFRNVMEKVTGVGNTVKYAHPGLTSSVSPWAIIATYDMWKHKRGTGKKAKSTPKMSDHARGFITFGSKFSESDFEDAQQQRIKIHDSYAEMFRMNQADILITPTLGCEAFHHGTTYPLEIDSKPITYPWLDWAGFLYDANLVGMPACSIPMGIGDQGLPISLQITGLPGSDSKVLEVAHKIESLLAWEYPKFNVNSYAVAISA